MGPEEQPEKIITKMDKERVRKEREKYGLPPENEKIDRDRNKLPMTSGMSGTKRIFD